jgi:hypothetical protein
MLRHVSDAGFTPLSPATTRGFSARARIRKTAALVADLYEEITGEPPDESEATTTPASGSDMGE